MSDQRMSCPQVLFFFFLVKIVTARCQILTVKCAKIDFSWGSTPDPAEGAYSSTPHRRLLAKLHTGKKSFLRATAYML